MISKTIKLGLFTLALCSVTLVTAQEKKQKNPEKAFEKMDTDSSASISLEEFKAKRLKDASKEERITKRFEKMDTNADGSLDFEEFKASLDKPKKKNKEKK